jgi:hypothetical protein
MCQTAAVQITAKKNEILQSSEGLHHTDADGVSRHTLRMGGDSMIEDPVQLLGRLRLGQEEYCQRLLTMLILAGPYPRWNSRSRPSEQGTQFLQALDALSFGDAAWDRRPQFVDEFDLPNATNWRPAAHRTMGCRGTTGCGWSS